MKNSVHLDNNRESNHTFLYPLCKNPNTILINFYSVNHENLHTMNFIGLNCLDKMQIEKIINLNLFFKGYYIEDEYLGVKYRSVNFSKEEENETDLFEKIISILNIEVNPIINLVSVSFSDDIFKKEDILSKIN